MALRSDRQSKCVAIFMRGFEKLIGRSVKQYIRVSLDILLALLGEYERILMNDEVSRERKKCL